MEVDWVVLCQAPYQSIKEDEWIEVHEILKEVTKQIRVKKTGRRCWLGKGGVEADIEGVFFLSQG